MMFPFFLGSRSASPVLGEVMAWKKISPEERRKIEKIREMKKKTKNRKPGPDDEGEVKKLKVLCVAICSVNCCLVSLLARLFIIWIESERCSAFGCFGSAAFALGLHAMHLSK
jgi:hypothetical protein